MPTFAEQHSDYADERGGWWVREQPIDWRYVDPSARLASDMAEPPPHASECGGAPTALPRPTR